MKGNSSRSRVHAGAVASVKRPEEPSGLKGMTRSPKRRFLRLITVTPWHSAYMIARLGQTDQ